MKDIGVYFKAKREEIGLDIKEVALDLKQDELVLQNFEKGNLKAFRDIIALRDFAALYGKYLGLDIDYILGFFDDLTFEHTSKIDLEGILSAKKELEKSEKRIYSPYTKPKREFRINLNLFDKNLERIMLLLMATLALAIFALIIALIFLREKAPLYELGGNYEFSQQNYYF